MEREGVPGFALRHGKAINVAVIGLCAWGVAALFTLPSGIYPDVSFPRIVVIAEKGEEAVQNMMIGVTRPLEEAVNAVPGLVRVRSKTIRGASELSLDFSPNADMRDALSQTRARVGSLLTSLPPGVTATIEQQTPSIFPVISFNATLDSSKAGGKMKDAADLLQWATLELKPRLSRIPDVFLVALQGAQSRAVIVEADPRRLAAAQLSIDEVADAIRDSNAVQAVGLLERDYKQYQILASNELRSLDQIERLPVPTRSGKAVHVGDLARVYAGFEDRTKVVTGNGQDSVVVSLFMRYGGKVTALSDHVKETLDDLSSTFPPGVVVTPVYDQANLVRDSLGSVRDAIAIGIALSVAVLWAFLGSWRLTFLAGISIPISVLGTFAILSAVGGSLNLMSTGGIAVAIGLIIDNAIVVVENIARKLRAEADRRASVVAATREILGAVVGSTLTTVVVFIPLVLLEGVVGQFFNAMAVSLAVGILVSMVISLTLTPMMAAGWLGPRPGERTTRAVVERVADAYERMIRRILARPRTAALALFAVVAVGGVVAWNQETGFLPQMDEGGFIIDFRMPVGTSLSETDKECRKVDAILLQIPAVKSFSRRTGAELGFFATEQNVGDFLVGLKPMHERKQGFAEVIDEVRGRVGREVPQIEISFVQVMQDTINDLAGNPFPIEVKLFGMDYKELQKQAKAVEKGLGKVPGAVDVQSGFAFGSPEITYRLDPDAVGRAGLTVAKAGDRLRVALFGEESTRLRRGEQLVPVLVRYPDAIRRDPTWIAQLPLAGGAGDTIPASLVGRVEEAINVNELERENQQPMVRVVSNLSGRDLGSAARDVRALLAALPPKKGVRCELSGLVESQERAFRNLLLVLSLAVGLVFLLLVIQFRSYRRPFIIFLTLPFSQVFALLALKITGIELNISAFMGLIMLIGLVVKNGIILIEYAAQLRAEGAPTLADALARAGRTRLRPIVMTSLTAVIALLPLALNLGQGAELQRPLAIAIIGGLSVSTLFTLIVVPVAHVLLGEPAHHRPAEAA